MLLYAKELDDSDGTAGTHVYEKTLQHSCSLLRPRRSKNRQFAYLSTRLTYTKQTVSIRAFRCLKSSLVHFRR